MPIANKLIPNLATSFLLIFPSSLERKTLISFLIWGNTSFFFINVDK